MLQQPSLGVPKGGRSRFSKALPSIPGSDAEPSSVSLHLHSHLPANPASRPNPLPAIPSSQPLAFPFPQREQTTTGPPLPLLPPTQPTVRLASAGGPPTMSIPRRPVGKQQAPPPPPEPLSPSDSLSSLLSAYSRSSGESLMRPSHDKGRDKESDSIVSPATSTTPQAIMSPKVQEPRPIQRKPVGASAKSPPPPPSKDSPVGRPATPPQDRPPSAELGTPTTTRPQIWRRRSLKGSRELADLKLDYSHGSTAATQSQAEVVESHAVEEPQKALPQPPRMNGGLPGRNIRPVATDLAQAMTDTRINERSDPQILQEKALPVPRLEVQSAASPVETTRPRVNRPPTPEYRNDDVEAPVVNHFVSPVSPASSPEPQKKTGGTTTKQLPAEPSQTRQVTESRSTALHAPPAVSLDLHSSKSVPDMRHKTSTPIREPFTMPLPIGHEVGYPERPASRGRDGGPSRNSGESTSMPPRSSSARPEQRRPMEQARFPPPEADPRLVYSDTNGYQFKGRDGTLYPEMKLLHEPDSRAFHFPTQTLEPLPEGAVIKACALQDSHFGCYQNHRFMNRRANWNYPLTCQTCEKSDAQDRWVCSFCHVRMCETCLQTFNANKRDLRRLQDALKQESTAPLPLPENTESAANLKVGV
ncbi:hypothetical protein S40288_04042 [Stachybotrys chartarum IBT 40288]|nr:hypothetical protein S40288_04042 [Stachybotrys chartarum IBT 40288]